MQMNLLSRLPSIRIGTRLALSYGAIMLLTITGFGYVVYSMSELNKDATSMTDEDLIKLSLAADMVDSANDVLREMRTIMLLQKDPAAVEIEYKKIEDARRKHDDAYGQAVAFAKRETGKALLRELGDAMQKARALEDRVILLSGQGKRDEALDLLRTEADPADRKVLDGVALYAKWQKDRTDKNNAMITQQFKETIVLAFAIAVLVLLSAVAAAYLVTRSITRPLYALQRAINDVRQGGSLESLANINTRDEMSDMGLAVNQLLLEQISTQEKADLNRQKAEAENDNLNNSVIALLQAVNQLSQKDLSARAPVTSDIIGTVSDSINQLTDETTKVLRNVNQIASQVAQVSDKVRAQGDLVSKTSEEERKNVGEMILSLGEATETMNQVAELANQSNNSAERATQVTNTALATVNSTVKGMESIRETIAETEKRIKRLGERSQEISGIVNMINTISERTHVLALNASMQAAVAGEAGRGFAVVAEEVQRLAESSRNATQQISTLVNNIQLETNETISTVNRTIGQVVQGSELVQKAGEQMNLTQEITGELVEQVRRITGTTERQKEMSAMLQQSVQRLGQSNERTARQIDTQSQETQMLMDSARQLVASVSVFKLPKLAEQPGAGAELPQEAEST
jgi:methyl-accepting chemotaxis protein